MTDSSIIKSSRSQNENLCCNFTFTHYRECLSLIKDVTVKSTTSIELIHDVDHFTDNLISFSEIEKHFGISAKYFIRLHSTRYNAFTNKNIKIFRKLVDSGHEIGLHFEPFFYRDADIRSAIEKAIQFFTLVTDIPLSAISIHTPLKSGTIDPGEVPEHLTLYCYNSDYYRGKKYLSDSGGRWREGCICNHIGKYEKMIILTHDLWWFHEDPSENY
jgi:hypothetical protein